MAKKQKEPVDRGENQGGGGASYSPVKSKKSNWELYALIAIAIIGVLLIILL